MSDDEEEWSVDDLRTTHECDEHWMLRKEFILRNKGRFQKLRLLSLSQVFCNTEFLGCKYPDDTMALVAEMSVGIVEEYRKKQSGRLQRTFIKASAAAEAKSKGTPSGNRTPRNQYTSLRAKNWARRSSREAEESISSPYPSLRYSFNTTDLNGFVLVEQLFLTNDTSAQLIHRSCQMSGKQCTYSFEHTTNPASTTCKFKLGNFTAVGTGTSNDSAKHAAADAALAKLRKICHTIQIKSHAATSGGVSLQELKGNEIAELDDSNVGNKLLRLMGWSGGGLGKSGTGIQEPIDTSASINIGRSRLGIGCSPANDKQTFTAKEVEGFLTKEFQNQAIHGKEIVFSSEFSKEEREIIHRVAHRLHLKSKSYGKADNRCLVISQKVTLPGLLQQIINDGPGSEKYHVIYPEDSDKGSKEIGVDLTAGEVMGTH